MEPAGSGGQKPLEQAVSSVAARAVDRLTRPLGTGSGDRSPFWERPVERQPAAFVLGGGGWIADARVVASPHAEAAANLPGPYEDLTLAGAAVADEDVRQS